MNLTTAYPAFIATGENFQDPRPGSGSSLGSDEWSVLGEVCNGDAMHLELMAKLLDTERQYQTMARRTGIYEALGKSFQTSSRSAPEAIANAHYKRDLKAAASKGDVDTVKQLSTWASLKFSKSRKE